MFDDRSDAGKQLGHLLKPFAGENVVVVGLPRGGVPVAYEVARILEAPLDVILVRKLGAPLQPELAIGAIGEDGVVVLNDQIIARVDATPAEIASVQAREQMELERRRRLFRAGRPRVQLRGKVVLIIDDGVATGATARAACQVARAEGAHRVILAVPVASSHSRSRLGDSADEVISLHTPPNFRSVGQFYRTFRQVDDHEVIDYLQRAAGAEPTLAGIGPSHPDVPHGNGGVHKGEVQRGEVQSEEDVRIRAVNTELAGHLTVPGNAVGIVIFAHGSGSSRQSPRNQFVASILNEAGMATLLFDLLTTQEAADQRNVFDVGLLGKRLAQVTAAVRGDPRLKRLPIGYFGASTGAAAALFAASMPENSVMAVVSRGGRPDLAVAQLAAVVAPTLLIVGAEDQAVLRLNQAARQRFAGEVSLAVVPGATHLFEEAGTLQHAAELARDWFLTHFQSDAPRGPKSGGVVHPEHVDHYPVEISTLS